MKNDVWLIDCKEGKGMDSHAPRIDVDLNPFIFCRM